MPRPKTQVKPVAKTEVVQDGVKSRKFKNLPNVTDGYYVVANVYKGGKYMDKFLTTLNNKGINADYIDNPDNGLKYVYLQRYETFDDAVAAYDSKLNGKYDGDMWIGTGSGYYLIANVFANPNNAKKFVKLLNSFGLSASYFINPKNNYRYVYLKKHDSWTNALISYYSKLNDAYNDKMWIMRVNQEQMA